MAHNHDWIPKRELEFKAWVNNFITKLSVYKTTLGITNQTFEQLQTEFTAYLQIQPAIIY
ncbi:MAG: hypothetical protein LBR17_02595 [Bacteroidales bacterium]|jgi:hypothetical protein|nr:hypothetical protein [Bacteroidales bacterium]